MNTLKTRDHSFFFISLFLTFIYSSCNSPGKSPHTYLNFNDTVKYVGMQTCATCHTDNYESFIKTGMGQSFDKASPRKSSASFHTKNLIYDSLLNFYYQPYWLGDTLKLKEFRLEGRDTVYIRIEKADFIIGSGQHTNSHLYSINGFLFQMPFTWYSQRKKWDLPPGFEKGNNTRFNRIIGLECMSCHNSYPGFTEGSTNHFTFLPGGIECERCHGAGELHVKLKRAGIHTDPINEIDYSIVNPAKLSPDLQMDICQRCHLQGNAVLKENKSFFDFKPGMKLSDIMDVFLPRYSGNQSDFIMASHPDRLKMSSCYLGSRKNNFTSIKPLTCISCHDPHQSVRLTPVTKYNNTCKTCHNNGDDCTLGLKQRLLVQDNCTKCHMPKSGTTDIPHVITTDHWIHKPFPDSLNEKQKKFLGILCLTDAKPSALTLAKGWINYYEKFNPNPSFLDSAMERINQAINENSLTLIKYNIYVHFLKEEYQKVIQLSESVGDSIEDPWTLYRIGESAEKTNNLLKAKIYFFKAMELAPKTLEFMNKYGSACLQLGDTSVAYRIFTKIIKENPKFESAYNNLGYTYVLKGNLKSAENNFDKALALNPDYELALANLASLYFSKKERVKTEKLVRKLMKLNPESAVYREFYKKCCSSIR